MSQDLPGQKDIVADKFTTMMRYVFASMFIPFIFILSISGQTSLNYALSLEPVTVPGLPGLHSYAFAQHDGKWLIIGGRTDGIHARQPFNAFPNSDNNRDLYVIDIETRAFWKKSLSTLPTNMEEQLQSTNMNFYQDGDTLYVIGGYAFSNSADDHITFPFLTSVQVSAVIDAVISDQDITSFFKQITDAAFAVTGGQLGKIGDLFYLVGGQRFDGRYNPMGHPTFVQTYTNQIRKFRIDNKDSQLSFSDYTTITDPVHLRRRDYNLMPQIFADGSEGYMISSGVFQENVDLPFLYPVYVTKTGYSPLTSFNQYLSNYHSATASLYDSKTNTMHSLFFGGMSQYYYKDGVFIQDDLVPFVNTISLVTRNADNTLQEFQLPVEMPGLKGASAEFIPNHDLPRYSNDIINLSALSTDTILIGYIYGGIHSPDLNPFDANETEVTEADNTIYAVRLISNTTASAQPVNGRNPFSMLVYPNPHSSELTIELDVRSASSLSYYLCTTSGQIVMQGELPIEHTGVNKYLLNLDKSISSQSLCITVIIDNTFFLTKTLIKI